MEEEARMLDRMGRQITRRQRDDLLGDPTYVLVANRKYELDGLEVFLIWRGDDDPEYTYEVVIQVHQDVLRDYVVKEKILWRSNRRTEAQAADLVTELERNIVQGRYQHMLEYEIVREREFAL
jgi:hypothetical protein